MNLRNPSINCTCEPYIIGRMKQMPHDFYTEPGKHMLELVYSNVYSPFRCLGTGGELY